MDLQVGEMLDRHGLTGTFYACPVPQHGRAMMSTEELKRLGASHEIGAHSMTHPHMPRLPEADARGELTESKLWIEDVTGKPCAMFCYPYGEQSTEIRWLARDAGYAGARGTRTLKFSADDRFDLPVSLQIYPFPWRRRGDVFQRVFDPLRPLRNHRPDLRTLGIRLSDCRSWYSLARALFLHALKTQQPFFHLYGHSHELERYGMWEDLEKFLAFVAQHHAAIEPVTNGEVVKTLSL